MSERFFTFKEVPNSRSSTEWPPSYTFRYRALGEFSDLNVRQSARFLTAPVVINDDGQQLNRSDIQLDSQGWCNYLVTIVYSKKNNEVGGSAQFYFDTTGGTLRIKAGKEHISTTWASGEPVTPDNPHKGAINVKNDGDVEGADIIIPVLKLSYTFRHPHGSVDEAFARLLARSTARFNSDTFRGFQAGELLFLGASGSQGTQSDSEVQYHFIASENADDLTIGAIASIAKKGHELLWIQFKPTVETSGGGKSAATVPQAVHIERVYDPIAFADTFGWS